MVDQPWIPGKLAEQYLQSIAGTIDDSGEYPVIRVRNEAIDGGTA